MAAAGGTDTLAAPGKFTTTGSLARTGAADTLAAAGVLTASASLARTAGADTNSIGADARTASTADPVQAEAGPAGAPT